MRNKPALAVYHPVARQIHINGSIVQGLPDPPRALRLAQQQGNLTIGCNPARGDCFYNLIDPCAEFFSFHEKPILQTKTIHQSAFLAYSYYNNITTSLFFVLLNQQLN